MRVAAPAANTTAATGKHTEELLKLFRFSQFVNLMMPGDFPALLSRLPAFQVPAARSAPRRSCYPVSSKLASAVPLASNRAGFDTEAQGCSGHQRNEGGFATPRD